MEFCIEHGRNNAVFALLDLSPVFISKILAIIESFVHLKTTTLWKYSCFKALSQDQVIPDHWVW